MSASLSTIGLIGAGAMGRALLAGVVRERPALAGGVQVADPVIAAAEAAVAESGGRVATVAEAAECAVVCLAVKPHDMAAVLAEIGPALTPETIVLSVAAGWDLERLSAALPADTAVVRTMPNLAVRHGAGVVAVAAHGLTAGQREALDRLLAPLGAVVALPEHSFPVATALAGSGPGLVAVIAEALEEGAVHAGLTRVQARTMVAGVIAGTAALLADGDDPATLRQRVSSPGGTTIEGIAVLERGAVRAHVAEAVRAAARRAGEL